MTLDEIVKTIAETVKESVGDAIKSVSDKYDAKISELESQIKSIPYPEKGDKGDSVSIEDIRPLVDEAVKSIDLSSLEKMVEDAISAIPEVKDGADGVSPSADEVAKSMEHVFAKWALDFERKADAVLEKAIDRIPKPKDGRDALDIDDFDISLADDGRTITMSLKRGEAVVEKSIKLAVPIDKGVFNSSNEYEKGDCVTYGGSSWTCLVEKTSNVPSSGNGDWRLAVKRGRDGKEAVKIELPKTVKVGA